jgi:hypothetical protein
MKIFADTIKEENTEVEVLQLAKLVQDWLQSQFDSYNYGAQAIVMLSENIVVFIETPEQFARIGFDNIKFGSDDGVFKLEFDGDGNEFYFGFLTESKIGKYPGDLELPISLTNDEDLINELKKTQGVKVTPLKCKNEDDLLETIN